MFCSNCGNSISDDEKFCAICGQENEYFQANEMFENLKSETEAENEDSDIAHSRELINDESNSNIENGTEYLFTYSMHILAKYKTAKLTIEHDYLNITKWKCFMIPKDEVMIVDEIKSISYQKSCFVVEFLIILLILGFIGLFPGIADLVAEKIPIEKRAIVVLIVSLMVVFGGGLFHRVKIESVDKKVSFITTDKKEILRFTENMKSHSQFNGIVDRKSPVLVCLLIAIELILSIIIVFCPNPFGTNHLYEGTCLDWVKAGYPQSYKVGVWADVTRGIDDTENNAMRFFMVSETIDGNRIEGEVWIADEENTITNWRWLHGATPILNDFAFFEVTLTHADYSSADGTESVCFEVSDVVPCTVEEYLQFKSSTQKDKLVMLYTDEDAIGIETWFEQENDNREALDGGESTIDSIPEGINSEKTYETENVDDFAFDARLLNPTGDDNYSYYDDSNNLYGFEIYEPYLLNESCGLFWTGDGTEALVIRKGNTSFDLTSYDGQSIGSFEVLENGEKLKFTGRYVGGDRILYRENTEKEQYSSSEQELSFDAHILGSDEGYVDSDTLQTSYFFKINQSFSLGKCGSFHAMNRAMDESGMLIRKDDTTFELLLNDGHIRGQFKVMEGGDKLLYTDLRDWNDDYYLYKVGTEEATLAEAREQAYNNGEMLGLSSQRYISEDELYGFGKEECRIARNEIYARHGVIFKSQDLNEYFGMRHWYQPSIPIDQFSSNMLSDEERANIKLIEKYEKEHGFR